MRGKGVEATTADFPNFWMSERFLAVLHNYSMAERCPVFLSGISKLLNGGKGYGRGCAGSKVPDWKAGGVPGRSVVVMSIMATDHFRAFPVPACRSAAAPSVSRCCFPGRNGFRVRALFPGCIGSAWTALRFSGFSRAGLLWVTCCGAALLLLCLGCCGGRLRGFYFNARVTTGAGACARVRVRGCRAQRCPAQVIRAGLMLRGW